MERKRRRTPIDAPRTGVPAAGVTSAAEPLGDGWTAQLVGANVGAYHIESHLARAPLGGVCEVMHTLLGRPGLALVQRRATTAGNDLIAAGRGLGTLNSRNMLPVGDLVFDSELVALVFAPAGRSLESVLAERGPLPWREAVAVLAPILATIRQFNRRRLTVGRLRIRDIVLSTSGVPRIVPLYGLRLIPAGGSQPDIRCEALHEEVLGAGEALHFLVTGRELSGRPGSQLGPARLHAILARATSPQPELRYAHVGELAAELGQLVRREIGEPSVPLEGLAPGHALGRYVITARMERLLFARIMRARHRKLGSRAHLIVFDKKALAASGLEGRLRRRMTVAAMLQHPNIVPTTDLFETKNLLVYIQNVDWAESCRQRLAARGPFRWSAACRIVRDIACALDYCHNRDILHLDVRPENILLTEDGRALLNHFFCALPPGKVGVDSSPWLGRPLLNHPPEVAAGEPVTPAADIWGLGVTLYRLIAGVSPFEEQVDGPEGECSYRSIRSLIPNVSEDMDLLLSRLLAPEPQRRYRRARDVANALTVLLKEAEPVTLPSTLVESTISMGPQNQYRLGEFMVSEVLGSGSYGDVYKVRRSDSDDEFALKILRDKFANSLRQVNRFERECETLQRINHPGVVRILENGTIRERPYLLMEFVSGEDLSRKMVRDGQIEPREALGIAADLAEALGIVHAAGVIHRDLKPHNILMRGVSGSGKPVITDFGSAHVRDGVRFTRTGEIIGSVAYMAPEQLDGRPLGPASDLYALGVVLFQMVSGQLPFEDDNPYQVMERIRSEPPPRLAPRNIPGGDAIDGVLERLLAKDPADRHSDGAALAALLREVAAELYKGAAAAPPPVA